MKPFIITLGLLLACGFAGRASAGIVVTFESAPIGVLFGGYRESGVAFAPVGGGATLFAGLTPGGSLGLSDAGSPKNEIRATFDDGADSVSVDLGDFGGDADTIFLQCFDSSGASLGFASRSIPALFSGMTTLSVEASGISYAIFGSRAPSTNGSSVYVDNFTYNPVPEPASILMLATGVIGVATPAWRRRRRG